MGDWYFISATSPACSSVLCYGCREGNQYLVAAAGPATSSTVRSRNSDESTCLLSPSVVRVSTNGCFSASVSLDAREQWYRTEQSGCGLARVFETPGQHLVSSGISSAEHVSY